MSKNLKLVCRLRLQIYRMRRPSQSSWNRWPMWTERRAESGDRQLGKPRSTGHGCGY